MDDLVNDIQTAALTLMVALMNAQDEIGRSPGGRELSLCVTKLEELVSWAERARWQMTSGEVQESEEILETGGQIVHRRMSIPLS